MGTFFVGLLMLVLPVDAAKVCFLLKQQIGPRIGSQKRATTKIRDTSFFWTYEKLFAAGLGALGRLRGENVVFCF